MSRSSFAIVVALTGAAMLLRVTAPFLWPLEQQAYDMRLSLRADEGWPEDLVLVPIDDAAMTMEAWPWKREKTAAFLDRLADLGVKTIALDVTLATETNEDADRRLAASLGRSVLAVGISRSGGIAGPVDRLSSHLIPAQAAGALPSEAFVVPLAQFLDGALGAGHIFSFADDDGRVRGHRPLVGIEGREGALPSLPLAAWAAHRGVDLDAFRWRDGSLVLPDTRMLPAKRGHLFLDFVRRGRPARTVAASAILGGQAPRLDGALAVVYVDSLYAPDFLATPLDAKTPGGTIVATAIRTIDRGNVPVPVSPGVVIFALLLPVIAATVALAKRRAETALAWFSAATLIYLIGCGALVRATDTFLPVTPVVLVIAGGIAATVVALRGATNERDRLQTLLRLAQSRATAVAAESTSAPTRADASEGRPTISSLAEGVSLDEPVDIGRYRVHRSLGAGGMGAIFLATDEVLKRPVALKVLRSPERGAFRRFRREAEAVARLVHPNVVQIFEVGFDARAPYLVMEFVGGGTLSDLLSDPDVEMPLPWQRTTRMILGAARGLGAAHAAGIVHRDVKPANLLLTTRTGDEVKVADFGIAKLAGEDRFTVEGSFVGTVGYLSPEQGLGKEVDARSDLYSLSVTWFRLLTGQRAFSGTTAEILKRSTRGSVPDPRETHPDVPEEISRLVLRLGALDPAERPRDGNAAASEIELALQRLTPSLR